ncbi:MAG: LPP20 family lipoprotein [Desulfobacterales bacterium]
MNKKYRLLPTVVGLLWIMILIFTGCVKRRSHTPTGDQAVKTEEVVIRKGERPAWIDGASRHYPSQKYLRGVGYDADRQTAEDKARTEIAKIFYSQIESQNSTYQSYLQTDTGGKLKTTEKIDIEDITRVSTHKVLSGVRIAEIYKQTRPKETFFALAVLDRMRFERILRTKILDLDAEIQELLDDAQNQADALRRIKYLSMGLEKLILRDTYNTELGIVSPAGQGIASVVSITEVRGELIDLLLNEFQIGLAIDGNRERQIRQILVEALNRQGFSVTEDKQNASVVIRGRTEFNRFEPQDSDWKYVRWKVFFDMIDSQSGVIFGSVSKNGKEGHLSFPQAEERALEKIRRLIESDIARELKSYILIQKD